MIDKISLALLVLIPVAVIGSYIGVPDVILFFISALAIVPLAKYLGEATEEISGRSGPAVGGFLNATLGNATELVIGILALQKGLIEVVKASITGSIIGNLLLVLGMAMFFGGLRQKKQTFNITAARAGASTLLVGVISLVIPAIFLLTSPNIGQAAIQNLSVFVSISMIVVYIAGLLFSLYTHKHLYLDELEKYEPKWSRAKGITILVLATLCVVWMSDILVNSISGAIDSLGWTQLFIGVVILAIIGNIAEHASAVTVAIKNRMDISLQISFGSATQMALFVAPLLVIVSLFLPYKMNLVFNIFELVAIVLSVFIANAVIEDGESNWLEGIQLMITYVIIAVAFFFHS